VLGAQSLSKDRMAFTLRGKRLIIIGLPVFQSLSVALWDSQIFWKNFLMCVTVAAITGCSEIIFISEVHLRTGHEDSEEELKYSWSLCLT
jgi:hypothetical protein